MILLPADPKARRRAVIFLMAVVVSVWYVAREYVHEPRRAQVEFARADLERLEAQNALSRSIVGKYDELRRRTALQRRQLEIFEEFIPESEEVPELLDAISREARMTGIELSRLRPAAAESGEFYTKQTWELSLFGEYDDIGRYLARIASLPRIIKPAGLTISPAAAGGATRDMEVPLEASLRIETFVLGDPAAGQSGDGERG